MTDDRTPPARPAASIFVEGFCAPGARKYVLFAAILASALSYIDSTVVAIAMPAIRSSLDASLAQAQWVHNAYMLTLASLILVGGAMSDRFGLARMFGFGIVFFVTASLFCAIAPTPHFLIGARAIQGIGAAIMVPGSLAVIARAYPREERGRAIGVWAASASVTTAAGPIIGSLALTIGGPGMWRWIFAINLPLGAIALRLLWRSIRTDHRQDDTPIDLSGAGTAILSAFCFAWGLTNAEHADTATTLLWTGAGALALVVFLWTEYRQPHPMMPLSLFRSPVFSAANLYSFLLYSGLSVVFFFMPMALVGGWGLREIDTSLAFAPIPVFMALLSSRAGKLADRIGPAPLLAFGGGVSALGYVWMALIAPEQRFFDGVLPAMCVVGLGMALLVAPLSTAVMGAVHEEQSGLASGINNAVSRMAGLMSVAAAGGIVAAAYAAAGGQASYGQMSGAAGHAAATSAGLAAAAWIAAALCGLSALIAVAMHRASNRWVRTG